MGSTDIVIHPWVALVAAPVIGIVAGVVSELIAHWRSKRDTATREHRADERHQLDLRQAQTRLFTERFGRAAEQLGDQAPAVRLAGVYAMAAVADEWDGQRQHCVDVLCAYLRLPPREQEGEDQVRLTVVSAIRQHLRDAESSWSELEFDLTGARFPAGSDLSHTKFGKCARFTGARFGGNASFLGATFTGEVWFDEATFGANALFFRATLGSISSFKGATLGEGATFSDARFDGTNEFFGATFGEGALFDKASFSGVASFTGARFGEDAMFHRSRFCEGAWFGEATFGGRVSFGGATFLKRTSFDHATFGGEVPFGGATFDGDVSFFGATVHRRIDLTEARLAEGTSPVFRLPDASETREMPVIGPNAVPGQR